MNEAKDAMAKDAAKVIDLPEDMDIIATAVLTKDNEEITLLLTECSNEVTSYCEVMIHTEKIDKTDGDTWITVGKDFKEHKDANEFFVRSLESYKRLGYVFPKFED